MKQLFGLLIATLIVLVIIGLTVQLAWNVVMPFAFGLPTIGLSHGIALFILARLLFVTRYNHKGE
jgi:TRAP-type C4-dicarboxylate transport system permease small subunit